MTTELNQFDQSRHINDPKLSDQKNVSILDNRHVRLTLWCLVYVILITAQLANNMYAYIYFDDELWVTPNANEIRGISINSILWFAVCSYLCSLYCAHCKCDCNGFTVLLFVVGSIMSFVTMIHDTQKECIKDDGSFPYDTDFLGYCRSLFIGSAIFLASFSMYLACDIMKSVGDDIRVRVCVKSLFISLRSFLLFAYWNKELNLLDDDDDNSVQFAVRTLSGGLLICGIVCSIILILMGIAIGYGSDGKKIYIYPFVARLLAFFLLSGVGSTMVIGLLFGPVYVQMFAYYAVAAVLVAYDLQYL